MKFAELESGQKVEATASAPKSAVCSCCNGEVTLRSRKTMNNGKRAYYWRHQSNRNRDCTYRTRPGS